MIEINVGEDPDDPVFFVSDLLIHLAQEQMEKKARVVARAFIFGTHIAQSYDEKFAHRLFRFFVVDTARRVLTISLFTI